MYETLEDAGLSEREIRVYLALLETGSTTTGPLVKKSGIPNSKIYETLEKLINKGLASYTILGSIKHFEAADPEMLLKFIEEKKERLKDLLPQLKLKQELGQNRQEATIYEGTQGLKTAFNKLLTTVGPGGEYQVFSIGQDLDKPNVIRFFHWYHKKREEAGVRLRIVPHKKYKKTFKKHHQYKKMRTRFTDVELPTGVYVFGDNVMTVIWTEKPTAFVITSRDNAARYKTFFEEVWKKARSA